MPKKKSEEEYIEKFNRVHNYKYQYPKFPTNFNQKTKIKIICPKHGEFQQIINNHSNGMGCPKCAKESMSRSKVESNGNREKYIAAIKSRYLDEYDFSNSDFLVPYDSKIEVRCKICGMRQMKRLSDLIKGKAGCSYCRIPKMQKTFYQKLRDKGKTSFLEMANRIYGNKYDYSQIDYAGNQKPVKIICPKHGAFLKSPAMHIYNYEGCPQCAAEANMSRYESITYEYLHKAIGNAVIPQFRILEDDYLRNKPYDFYIPDIKMLIEVDGEQHRKLCWNMDTEDLKARQTIDGEKTRIATELGYTVVRLNTDTQFLDTLENELTKFEKVQRLSDSDGISQQE